MITTTTTMSTIRRSPAVFVLFLTGGSSSSDLEQLRPRRRGAAARACACGRWELLWAREGRLAGLQARHQRHLRLPQVVAAREPRLLPMGGATQLAISSGHNHTSPPPSPPRHRRRTLSGEAYAADDGGGASLARALRVQPAPASQRSSGRRGAPTRHGAGHGWFPG
jgi:hypothetical protein